MRGRGDPFKRGNRMMLAVLLMISLPFILGAAWMAWRSVWYANFAESSPGKIVEIKGRVPKLVIEFVANGQMRRSESAGSDLYKNYQVGDKVKVFWKADDPGQSRPDLFVDMWILPIVLGVFGFFFFIPSVLVFGDELRALVRPRDLDQVGQLVQADYDGYQLTLDFDRLNASKKGKIGNVSLSSENGKYTLVHNGEKRDPNDPQVRRELGIRYVAQFKWTDPKTGKVRWFQSDPIDVDPERQFKGRKVPVRIDPEREDSYRIEGPFGGSGAVPGGSVIE